jgi:hypothetical protein
MTRREIARARILISLGRAQQSNGATSSTFPSPKNLMGPNQEAEIRNSGASSAYYHAMPSSHRWGPGASGADSYPSPGGTHRPVSLLRQPSEHKQASFRS